MTDLYSGLRAVLPLTIGNAEWADPSLILAGDDWSITVSSPWRVASAEGLVLGGYEARAVDAVGGLRGLDIVDVAPQSAVDLDPAFRLSDRRCSKCSRSTRSTHGS